MVLLSDQAVAMLTEVVGRMREKMKEDIEGRLIHLVDDAVSRLAETLSYKDFVVGSDGKKHQDNIALGFLKGVGMGIQQGGNGVGEKAQAPLNEVLSERLINALEASNKADEIRQLGKGEVSTDAKFEEVIVN